MPTFRRHLDIAADSERLFALTQDYGQRLEWDPFLREARLLDGAKTPEVGARAWCAAHSGLGMETEYVSFQPPKVTAVRMTRGPWFLASFAGAWRFEPIGDGVTRVHFIYHLEARPRWLRRLLNPILQGVFAGDTRERLRALRQTAEADSDGQCHRYQPD